MKNRDINTKSALVQTTLRVSETDEQTLVICDRGCQTLTSALPTLDTQTVIPFLEFVPYSEIVKDSQKIIDLPKKALLQFDFHRRNPKKSTSDISPNKGVLKKSQSSIDQLDIENIQPAVPAKMPAVVQDEEIQTDLTVSPYVLDDDTVANVYAQLSVQTSVTFEPTESLSAIAPELKKPHRHTKDFQAVMIDGKIVPNYVDPNASDMNTKKSHAQDSPADESTNEEVIPEETNEDSVEPNKENELEESKPDNEQAESEPKSQEPIQMTEEQFEKNVQKILDKTVKNVYEFMAKIVELYEKSKEPNEDTIAPTDESKPADDSDQEPVEEDPVVKKQLSQLETVVGVIRGPKWAVRKVLGIDSVQDGTRISPTAAKKPSTTSIDLVLEALEGSQIEMEYIPMNTEDVEEVLQRHSKPTPDEREKDAPKLEENNEETTPETVDDKNEPDDEEKSETVKVASKPKVEEIVEAKSEPKVEENSEINESKTEEEPKIIEAKSEPKVEEKSEISKPEKAEGKIDRDAPNTKENAENKLGGDAAQTEGIPESETGGDEEKIDAAESDTKPQESPATEDEPKTDVTEETPDDEKTKTDKSEVETIEPETPPPSLTDPSNVDMIGDSSGKPAHTIIPCECSRIHEGGAAPPSISSPHSCPESIRFQLTVIGGKVQQNAAEGLVVKASITRLDQRGPCGGKDVINVNVTVAGQQSTEAPPKEDLEEDEAMPSACICDVVAEEEPKLEEKVEEEEFSPCICAEDEEDGEDAECECSSESDEFEGCSCASLQVVENTLACGCAIPPTEPIPPGEKEAICDCNKGEAPPCNCRSNSPSPETGENTCEFCKLAPPPLPPENLEALPCHCKKNLPPPPTPPPEKTPICEECKEETSPAEEVGICDECKKELPPPEPEKSNICGECKEELPTPSPPPVEVPPICSCKKEIPPLAPKELVCTCRKELPPPPEEPVCTCRKDVLPSLPPPPEEPPCTCKKELPPTPPPPPEEPPCTCKKELPPTPPPPPEEPPCTCKKELPPPPEEPPCTCKKELPPPPPKEPSICSCRTELPPPPSRQQFSTCECKFEQKLILTMKPSLPQTPICTCQSLPMNIKKPEPDIICGCKPPSEPLIASTKRIMAEEYVCSCGNKQKEAVSHEEIPALPNWPCQIMRPERYYEPLSNPIEEETVCSCKAKEKPAESECICKSKQAGEPKHPAGYKRSIEEYMRNLISDSITSKDPELLKQHAACIEPYLKQLAEGLEKVEGFTGRDITCTGDASQQCVCSVEVLYENQFTAEKACECSIPRTKITLVKEEIPPKPAKSCTCDAELDLNEPTPNLGYMYQEEDEFNESYMEAINDESVSAQVEESEADILDCFCNEDALPPVLGNTDKCGDGIEIPWLAISLPPPGTYDIKPTKLPKKICECWNLDLKDSVLTATPEEVPVNNDPVDIPCECPPDKKVQDSDDKPEDLDSKDKDSNCECKVLLDEDNCEEIILGQNDFVYDNPCFVQYEPYLAPVYKLFPEDCDTYCGPFTEIHWSDILIPKNVRLRQVTKSNSTTFAKTPPEKWLDSTISPDLTGEKPSVSERDSVRTSEMEIEINFAQIDSTLIKVEGGADSQHTVSEISTISDLRMKVKRCPKDYIVTLTKDGIMEQSQDAAQIKTVGSQPFTVTLNEIAQEKANSFTVAIGPASFFKQPKNIDIFEALEAPPMPPSPNPRVSFDDSAPPKSASMPDLSVSSLTSAEFREKYPDAFNRFEIPKREEETREFKEQEEEKRCTPCGKKMVQRGVQEDKIIPIPQPNFDHGSKATIKSDELRKTHNIPPPKYEDLECMGLYTSTMPEMEERASNISLMMAKNRELAFKETTSSPGVSAPGVIPTVSTSPSKKSCENTSCKFNIKKSVNVQEISEREMKPIDDAIEGIKAKLRTMDIPELNTWNNMPGQSQYYPCRCPTNQMQYPQQYQPPSMYAPNYYQSQYGFDYSSVYAGTYDYYSNVDSDDTEHSYQCSCYKRKGRRRRKRKVVPSSEYLQTTSSESRTSTSAGNIPRSGTANRKIDGRSSESETKVCKNSQVSFSCTDKASSSYDDHTQTDTEPEVQIDVSKGQPRIKTKTTFRGSVAKVANNKCKFRVAVKLTPSMIKTKEKENLSEDNSSSCGRIT